MCLLLSIEIKETDYENYGKCVRISNKIIDVVVTIDFGPRIVRFGFVGGANILYNDLERNYVTRTPSITERYGKDAAFYSYGGHRVWLSPERMPETYYPDNEPVIYGILPEGVSFTPARQRQNELQLSFEVIMGEEATDIMIVHSAKNFSKEKQALSLCAVTMVAGGGVEIIPQNQDSNQTLLPNRTISVWPYTDIADKRIFLGNKYLTVRQDASNEQALKIGVNNILGWAAYVNGGYTLVKHYVHDTPAVYPDFGCSYETSLSKDYVEMNSLSPIYGIEQGKAIRHVENLSIHKTPDFSASLDDEDAIEKFIKSLGCN
jgi:hypothetical protein